MAAARMRELTAEKQRLVTGLEEESRTKVQMSEIEAMREDAARYEQMRKQRLEMAARAEENIIATGPLLDAGAGARRGSAGAASGSDGAAAATPHASTGDDGSEYELSSDGGREEEEDPPKAPGVAAQSPLRSQDVIDVLGHYLDEDGGADVPPAAHAEA